MGTPGLDPDLAPGDCYGAASFAGSSLVRK
jgi:hypothetical protein